ncbi:MAG: FAD-binding oxidoreductase [Candidatus Hodarchaeota archaeon]
MVDNYAYQWNADNLSYADRKFAYRPLCVVLPEKTEEIVKIVKYCNTNGLQFKAQSTGWGVHNSVGKDDSVILLDLRRMDKILGIDEKNMIAIVEPYVSSAMLQVELFKLGLNCHIAGCGANGSQLVTVTSMVGQGWTGISTGFSNRNILGAEWVMPDGNICKVGAWGSFKNENVDASEWFLADGPGPSIRGVYRGYFGAFGGLGVFTKAAIKLYHWAGPETLKIQGKSPIYGLFKYRIPKYTEGYHIIWNDWEDFKDAGYLLAHSEVCWALCRIQGFDLALAAAPSNTAMYNDKLFQDLATRGGRELMVITMGANKKEAEYHKKVIEHIVEATNGEYNEYTGLKPLKALFYMAIVKQCNTMRGVFRAGGGFFTSLGALGSWDWCVEGAKIGEKLKQKIIDTGGIVDDGADNAWGLPYEQGTFGHLEELYMYDLADPESRKASVEYLKSVVEASKKYPLGLGLGTVDSEGSGMHNVFGPIACNYHKWLKRIKQEFDPNTASDPGFYIDPALVKD